MPEWWRRYMDMYPVLEGEIIEPDAIAVRIDVYSPIRLRKGDQLIVLRDGRVRLVHGKPRGVPQLAAAGDDAHRRKMQRG